ncbi:MAG TPA: sulfite exporter TauE/SafE family protein [Fervidobacterium sp.]|nr:sulfite exporter TauE/SafE family protein [Fervidobacterium sp.]HOM73710.1 sulfite exporter TauE/SafE family protein [Fervidobacterium sp.]HPP17487.1 sulfite exporter TauE/SafE family protein [Fervidobacterium sp.]HRD20833.1 sulfite exporter TauE/SafE family protein [Fervidobacterium sp.]
MSTMGFMLYALLFLGGLGAGIINVLAGGGSFLTLPLLSIFGLSPSIANGTNRIAILMQNISATVSFSRKKVLDIRKALYLAVPTVIGSIIGAHIAVEIPDTVLERGLGIIFIIMAFFNLFSKDEENRLSSSPANKILEFFVFFLIGIYGGFIQAGVGFFLIAALRKLEGEGIRSANVLKIFLTLMFTIFSILVFSINSKIQLIPGLVLGAGSFFGGIVGAHLNLRLEKKFLKYTLFAMMILSAILYLF